MRTFLPALSVLTICFLAGCAAPPPPEGLLSQVEDARLSEIQLRERVNDAMAHN